MYHILQIKLFMQRSIYNFYSIYSVYLQIKFTVRVTTFYYLHLLINYYYRTLDGDKKKNISICPIDNPVASYTSHASHISHISTNK